MSACRPPGPLAGYLAVLLLASTPTTSSAQHMFLDTNGDGMTTGADTLSASGPTEVAVWLRTDGNRDGTPAVCAYEDEPLTVNSYEFILHAIGGTVSYASFGDAMGFGTTFGTHANAVDFYAGRGGSTILPPGLYRLGTVTITVTSGSPVIDFSTTTAIHPVGLTAFGSACPGREFDNTLKLGVEWHDVDGLGTGRSVHAPVLTPIADMAMDEGTVGVQTLYATDADGDSLSFSKLFGPAFMTVTTVHRDPTAAEGLLRLTPGFTDAGVYSAAVRVTDGSLTPSATIAVTVNDVPTPIAFTPLPDVLLAQHADTLLPIDAFDPNGGTLQFSLSDAPPYVTLTTAPRGLRLRPRLHADVGTARAVVRIAASFETVLDTVEIQVLPNPLPPRLAGTMNTPSIGVELVLRVEATDPEDDPIASLVFDGSALPPSDTVSFTTSAENRLGTLRWTPSIAGTFTVRFTATDATGSTATEAFAIVLRHGEPRITAPAAVRARPLEPVLFTVTVSSPDGAPITSLELLPNATTAHGATFTVDPSQAHGTYAWMPPLDESPSEGCACFTLLFRGTVDDDVAVASTTIEVSRTDVDTLHTESFDLIVSSAAQAGFEPLGAAPGLVAPPGSNKTLLRGIGPWIVGKSGGAIRVARGGGDTEFAPGASADGVTAPYDVRFRNYRLVRGDATNPDYLAWPVADGAPVTPRGDPLVYGKTQLWSVAQDVAPVARAIAREYELWSDPVPVELRQTSFVYDDRSSLADMAFFRYAFTYRGATPLDSAYVAVWADPDLGNPNDDLAGYDRGLEMGFVYNALEPDAYLGFAPPAVGVVWLGRTDPGAPSLNARAFQVYTTSEIVSYPLDATRSFLLAQGKHLTGDPVTVSDDKLAETTTFRFDGDPVTGAGWRDDWSRNKRIVLAAGPLSLAPNETVSFAAALLVGRGTDRLSAVSTLRKLAAKARLLAGAAFVPEPDLDAPEQASLLVGQPFTLRVTALDPDGDPLAALAADLSGLPSGHRARFEPDADFGGGALHWTPSSLDIGDFIVAFTATSERTTTAETILRVRATNHAPEAHAGGPYAGIAGEPLALSAAASRDADGDRLFCAWTFGDGSAGNGLHVLHRYDAVGIYLVTAQITDGLYVSTAKTTATITEEGALRAWAPETRDVLPLASAGDGWCLRIEPFPNTFALSSIAAPVRLVRHEAGERREAAEDLTRRGPVEDADGNGIPDRSICFSLAELRGLFGDLPAGATASTLTVEGTVGDGAFAAPFTATILAPPVLRGRVAPNPVRRDGVLVVRTSQAGRLRVTLHDVRGRCVRSLENGSLPAGIHSFPLDGRDGSGRTLPSGVYFYRIDSAEGAATGRLTLLR